MLQSQENRLSMWAAVISHLDAYSAIWNGLPAFVTAYGDFKAKHALLSSHVNRQAQKTSGVTQDKKKRKVWVSQTAMVVSGNVRAYAISIDDATVLQNNTFSQSLLERTADTRLGILLQRIHDTAVTLLPDMAGYGNTAASLADFQTQIDDYLLAIAKPRHTTAEKKAATILIDKTLHEGTLLLEVIDNLILNFRVSQTTFYIEYLNCREIIDHAHHYTRCVLHLTESLNSDPLQGATVIISDSDCGVVKTNAAGVAVLKPVSPGTHTLDITHPDYHPATLTQLVLKRGKTLHLTTSLIPI